MKLRPYQTECVEKSLHFMEESGSTIAVLATGLGKTVIAAHIAKEWRGGRILFMAHRDILIHQAADKFERIIGERPEIEMGQTRADCSLFGSDFVVTSVQTMSRTGRHKRFDPADFGLIIIDEAHHAVASTYRRVIEYFSGAKIFGCTATPDRADKRALGKVFTSESYRYEISDAVEDGYLVEPHGKQIVVESLDLSEIGKVAGDLNRRQLSAVLEDEKTELEMADSIIQETSGLRTLVFCASVAQACKMSEILRRYERSAGYICSDTTIQSPEERKDMIFRFRSGDLQYLVNVGIATEGFDVPEIDCVAMCRQTMSRALYTQMVGRGTRPLDGLLEGLEAADERKAAIANSAKPRLLVLDFVDNTKRHDLVCLLDALGGKYDDDVVARAKSERNGSTMPVGQVLAAAAAKMKAEEDEKKRKEIKGRSKYRSQTVNLVAPKKAFTLLGIRPQTNGKRGLPATQPQREMLERNGISVDANMDRKQASQLIGKIIDRRKKGLCTFKQARRLSEKGYDPDTPFEDASMILDQIFGRR